jgi:hypothetical protein
MELVKIEIKPADNGWIMKETKREKAEHNGDEEAYYDEYDYKYSTKVFSSIDDTLESLGDIMNEN